MAQLPESWCARVAMWEFASKSRTLRLFIQHFCRRGE
jgi:hypothetical protein